MILAASLLAAFQFPPGANAAGERSHPIAIVTGAPLRPDGQVKPLHSARLPQSVGGDAPATTVADVASFVQRGRSPMITDVDLVTGRILRRHPPAFNTLATPLAVIDGVAFAYGNQGYLTYDAATHAPFWNTLAIGGAYGAPQIYRDMALQAYTSDGATLVNNLGAFDLRTGAMRWTQMSDGLPLGYGGGTSAYINSTWFPATLDTYLPLTLARIDLLTGAKSNEYSYRPDPEQNFSLLSRATVATPYVRDGYLYLGVNATWYRYRTDRQPANPASFGTLRVRMAFENGALLVDTPTGAAVAESKTDRLVLHAFAYGSVRLAPVTRSDGRTYALIGNTVIAFDISGNPARLGSALCEYPVALQLDDANIALYCRGTRDLEAFIFRDIALTPMHLIVRPARPPRAALRLAFNEHPYPNATPPAQPDWQPGDAITAIPGGMAFIAGRGFNVAPYSIGFTHDDGSFNLVDLPPGVTPARLVTDGNGTVWFSDRRQQTIGSVDASGTIAFIGDRTQPSYPLGIPRGVRPLMPLGIAIADGNAWYARNQSGVIARADGSRMMTVPKEYTPAQTLRASSDGTLWFLNRERIVHLGADGRFAALPLPFAFSPYPPIINGFEPGADGSMWIAAGHTLVNISTHGVVRIVHLPTITTWPVAMVYGCDGKLYVPETVDQLAVIDRDGDIREYPEGDDHIEQATRGADCRLRYSGWGGSGGNRYRTYGTFSLIPNR